MIHVEDKNLLVHNSQLLNCPLSSLQMNPVVDPTPRNSVETLVPSTTKPAVMRFTLQVEDEVGNVDLPNDFFLLHVCGCCHVQGVRYYFKEHHLAWIQYQSHKSICLKYLGELLKVLVLMKSLPRYQPPVLFWADSWSTSDQDFGSRMSADPGADVPLYCVIAF